jgi:hypothetical protein
MRFILKHVCIELPTLPSKTINKKYSTKEIWNNNRITIKMIDMAQHKINSEYNKFLNQLVLWSYFYKRVEAERKKDLVQLRTMKRWFHFKRQYKNVA